VPKLTLHILPEPVLSIIKVTLRPEDASIPATPMLQDIPKFPPFRKLQLHARQPRQQIIPNLSRLLHSQVFPQDHNVSHPPVWVVMNRSRFLCICNPNNQALVITVVTTNQHVQITRLRRSRLYKPPPCT